MLNNNTLDLILEISSHITFKAPNFFFDPLTSSHGTTSST